MAKEKKPSSKKRIRQVKPTASKKPVSMRESAAKSRADSGKVRRVRRAASAAKSSGGKVTRALTTELHVLPRGNEEGFFSKSRSLTPRYIRNAWNELKQVSWPGRRETWRLVFAVFIFAIALGTTIAVLDYGLEKLLREVIL